MSERERQLREDRAFAVVFAVLFLLAGIMATAANGKNRDRADAAEAELCAIHFERSDTLLVLRARPYCKLEGVR